MNIPNPHDKPVSPEIVEARLRLEKEVKTLQARQDRGEIVVRSHEERMAQLNASQGIISMGDAIKEALPILRKQTAKFRLFRMHFKKWRKAAVLEKCPEHGCNLPVDDDKTFGSSYRERKLVMEYKECPDCKRQIDSILVNEKLNEMGIPEKVHHATLENFETDTPEKKKAISKIQWQLKRNGGFLILRGKFGTGKSHLAAAVLKERGGFMVTEADLVAMMRQTYVDDTSLDAIVTKYKKCKVMVLDELTSEVKGVDIPILLYRILGYRHDKGLLTVITSNETLETVLSILGGRITDRLRENYTVVTMEWESHRKAIQ